MKIDLSKLKLLQELVVNNDNKKIFVKEQIYRNEKGWLYIFFQGGERSCYGIKKAPYKYKARQGVSRISKKTYELWKNSHEEFISENGWFIDWEREEREDELWEDAEKQIKYFNKYILKSLKEEDLPF